MPPGQFEEVEIPAGSVPTTLRVTTIVLNAGAGICPTPRELIDVDIPIAEDGSVVLDMFDIRTELFGSLAVPDLETETEAEFQRRILEGIELAVRAFKARRAGRPDPPVPPDRIELHWFLIFGFNLALIWEVPAPAPEVPTEPQLTGTQEPPTNMSDGTGPDCKKVDSASLDFASGQEIRKETDLLIPGVGFPFEFARTYRSFLLYEGPLGHGWTHSFNEQLFVRAEGDVLHFGPDGRLDLYEKTSAETFRSPPGIYAELGTLPDGSEQRLCENP